MKKILLTLTLCIRGLIYLQAQTVLSGVLLDKADRQPILGASIVIKGTTYGSISDAFGNFRVESKSDTGTLVVRMVGYTTLQVPYTKSSVYSLEMESDNVNLNEIVVIGYGETRKKDLSTAVSTIDLKSMKSMPTNAIGMLQGRLAGVSISSDGGDPLSEASVIVRGKGNRYGENPLYVVDGVPGAPYNTEDVVSITLLKDAASAAIYGAHVGSGGVFIITTKKAQTGDIKISANAYHGWQSAAKIPHALTAAEYNKVVTDAANAGNGIIPSVADANIYPYGQVTRTDWTKEIFRTGKMDHYAFSITGGSEKLKAISSFEYNYKDGILLNTYAKDFGARLNIDYKINDKINFTQACNYKYTNGQGDINTYSHTGVIASAMFMPSSAPVYEENGSYCGTVPEKYEDLGVAGGYGEVQNPVATLHRLDQYRPEHTLFSTSVLAYNPFPFLNIRTSFSIRDKQDRYEDFVSSVPEIGKTDLSNSRTLESGQGDYWLWENTATFNKIFAMYHSVNFVLGYSEGRENYRSHSLTVTGFDSESNDNRSINNATDWSSNKPTEEYWEDSQVSSFGRLSYIFNNKYFFTASCRYDATSKLPKANNSQFFPAVSGAWKLSSEPFFANNLKAFSLAKIRASWGQIGNVGQVPHYPYVSLATSDYITYLGENGGNAIDGLGLTTVYNPDLKWETSQQTDLGLDLGFFKDRVTLSADYFIKKTINMIDNVPMPEEAGVEDEPYGNIGDTRNKGVEFVLDYNQKIGDLTFHVGGNYTYQENEVTSLGNQDYYENSNYEIRGISMLRSKVGQPWYSYYLYKTDGLFQSKDDVNSYTFNGNLIQKDAQPGDLKFKDISGPNGVPDGKINEYDRTYCGSYAPKHLFGFYLNAEFKGLDFGIQFQGVAGNKIFNGFKLLTMEGTQGWNMSKDILNSWTYNKSSDIARVTNTDPNGNYGKASDYFLQDGSYLRLKNVTIGYTFPKSILSKINCDKATMRVYVSGQNICTWTKYQGMDPEVGNNGLDGGRYPVARVFNAGLSIGF